MSKFILILIWGGLHGGPALESFDTMASCQKAAQIIEIRINTGFLPVAKTDCVEVPR